MKPYRLYMPLLSAALLWGLNFPRTARACAAAPPWNARVQVVDESAVIVWDAANHQEQFIRRATFNATSSDFGFLVPTPSVPSLAEAKDLAFGYLEHLIQPEVLVQKQRSYFLSSLFAPEAKTSGATLGSGSPSGSVEVLDTQHVAGYDAVVLSADRADALLKWLQSHGYASRPALHEWLTPYVQAHWKITAFKISKVHSGSDHASSSAVRMSFTTERPFFPYREPADQREPGNHSAARSLRVFLLSTERMDGVLGKSGTPDSWPGKVVSARPIEASNHAFLKAELALSDDPLPAKTWLTAFEDHSSPRPGTAEVYFAPAREQTPVLPPPVTTTQEERVGIPIEPCLLVVGLGVFGVVVWRRKRSRRPDKELLLREN